MYIIIKTDTGMAQIRTSSYNCIYDYLIDNGYCHEIAEDVACWATTASIGDEYELTGAEIIIAY